MDRVATPNMKPGFVIFLFAVYVLNTTSAWAAASNLSPSGREAYRYTSDPGDDRARENIYMTYDYAKGRVLLSSHTLGQDSQQTVAITLMPQGGVISATLESKSYRGGEIIRQSQIRKEQETVYVEDSTEQKSGTRRIRVPEGRELAVDASLLYLMRQFPFGTEKEWRVFMVDFSGQSVTVSIRNNGTELVNVPAGAFSCYRMEVKVRILFLNATLTYWLAKNLPHFLVKHVGKKGPFTKTYTTILEAIDSPYYSELKREKGATYASTRSPHG
jgi:hypothetical protein